MRRWPDDAARAEPAASLLTARQLGVASALLVVAAALAYHWTAGGDDTRSGAATGMPSPGLPAKGTGGTQGAVESGTSILMANPFSTFQQTAPADPAPVTGN
jgi:hypothetical protein